MALRHKVGDLASTLVSVVRTRLELFALEASGQKMPDSKPILEINPNHPLVERLEAQTQEASFTDLAALLCDQAALAAGESLEDPGQFVQRLNRLLLELAAS